MTHHMIGKVLQGRYQIVQSLGAGVFGQTYVAVDIEHPENPKCVVKQLKVTSFQSSHLDTLRLRFLTETQTLRQLGHHNQIPELIACFEEHERFYLVQEFIEGHALSAELPLSQGYGYFWEEGEVIQFLIDVLEILDFIHSQGVIHCDIKPENLIRRVSDGKLVLIDFGSIQPVDFGIDSVLPIYRIPVTSLGYIPPEQFIGQTKPNSDIYALGMIVIQALTGLTPLQLKVDPQSNEISWRLPHLQISDYLAATISQMIRYNHEERFQSVTEVLQVLRQISIEAIPHTVEAEYRVIEESRNRYSPTRNHSSTEKTSPSPLLTGVRVGLLANSVVMGFGVYSLLNSSPAYSETETLYKATEEYQSGDLQSAIALAKSIPSHSNVYPEAQATIQEWQQQWQVAAERYNHAEKAMYEGQWSEVLQAAPQVPDILYWQAKTDRLVKQAKSKIEVQGKGLLTKAYEKAAAKDFHTALDYLNQVPRSPNTNGIVEQKIAEYTEKRQIRAAYLLQEAYRRASDRDFATAVKFLEQIPQQTHVYTTAQAKLVEYTQKQRLAAQGQKVAALKTEELSVNSNVNNSRLVTPNDTSNSFIRTESSTRLQDFQPGDLMQEVNIR